MAALTLRNISKTYDENGRPVKALDSVNLRAKAGEFICVIGPNGSGKSTLLKIIASIETPTTGELTVPNRIAYVPQQPSLLPWRTVTANLSLPGEIEGNVPARSDIRKWLREFGLLDFADMYPAALSGGMQQKVALVRAALVRPDLLLLDEPFASLDAITRLESQRWLRAFAQKLGCGVVCVTHDVREAAFLADTVYVLSKRPGRIKRRLDVKRPGTKSIEKTLIGLVASAP